MAVLHFSRNAPLKTLVAERPLLLPIMTRGIPIATGSGPGGGGAMCVDMTWEAKARARHRLESESSVGSDVLISGKISTY